MVGGLTAACSSSSDTASDATTPITGLEEPDEVVAAGDATVLVANAPATLTTGVDERVLVALLGSGPTTPFVGDPEVPLTFEVSSGDGAVAFTVEGRFVEAGAAGLGMYVTHMRFDQPGQWEVAVAGSDKPGGFFDVVADPVVPQPGAPAPATATPTATSVEAARAISTDPEPALRFYQLSLDEAIASGRPTVAVFATPAFCQTLTCGPTLDITKNVADDHPAVNFVHVEPYDIALAEQGTLEITQPMVDWGLPTEPWVYLIDANGTVQASFEGLLDEQELAEAVDEL
ncbi:MAG: TlpA family protein disulfide reductase [Acidimicrobiales bacterium]